MSDVETQSLSEQAYQSLRKLIVRLDFAPGDVLREDELRERLGIGRTPIREALQRLEREHFVNVIPRRGMFVAGVDVTELSMLFETRTVLEPYAAKLAAVRGTEEHWASMDAAINTVTKKMSGNDLLDVDRTCHELMWEASGNHFLIDTLDMLYAQSDRLWHLYLAEVAEPAHAVEEHIAIMNALRSGDADKSASLMEDHVKAFDAEIRAAVSAQLEAPLAG